MRLPWQLTHLKKMVRKAVCITFPGLVFFTFHAILRLELYSGYYILHKERNCMLKVKFFIPMLFSVLVMFGCTGVPSGTQGDSNEEAKDSYDILVFGDTHFDSPDVRTNTEKLSGGRKKEMQRNFEVWQERMSAMLKAAGERSKHNIAFAVQLGDLIQGDCGSKKLQTKSYQEALQHFTDELKVPFYCVKGNHDIRGHGAANAYKDYMLPWLQKSFGQETWHNTANHYLKYGNDLFIFFDSLQQDSLFVKEVLDKYPDVRHVFFLTHLPLLPCSFSQPDWIVFGNAKMAEKRRQLLQMLAEKDTIVLAAHIHRTALFQYEFPKGKIVQQTFFSMPEKSVPESIDTLFEPDGGKFFSDSYCKSSVIKKSNAIIPDFKEFCRNFTIYKGVAGFYVLHVSEKSITVDFYIGDYSKPVKTIRLR